MKAVKPHPKTSIESSSPSRRLPEVIELPPPRAVEDWAISHAAEPAPEDPFNEEGMSDPTLFEDAPKRRGS